jgi:iron complex outermembrane receptor protein
MRNPKNRAHGITRLLLWLLASLAAPAWAEVTGRVTSIDGVPVENARVTASEGETRFTDYRGAFTFPDLEAPTALTVSHPRFLDASVEAAAGSVLVALEPKQEIFHEIAVSANRGEESFSPTSSSASVIDVGNLATPVATLADVIATAPGVAENGQGGIFQTFSIRGVARQRVLTLLSGMRVVGERRAGVSASFVDPRLMGKVDVIRGPSSTYYGSGALGGVVQMFPRNFDETTIEIGYDSNGDGSHELFGWGDGDWSLGVAHRRSDEGESAGGLELNDGFDQLSAIASRGWRRGEIDYSLQTIASHGSDIGKSNSDFPDRITVYPEENHLMMRFAVSSERGWRLDAWAHPNDLRTRVLRSGTVTTTDNEAFDLGFNWQSRSRWDERTELRYGVEYFGRKGVLAEELIEPVAGRAGPTIFQTPLDGGEDELGLYGAFERNWGGTVLLLGGRVAVQRQNQRGAPRREDSALTGFAGVVVPLKPGLELAANLGSGLRFPSLSERFFNGVTPRGDVAGNSELEAERSLSRDLALRYYGTRLFLSTAVFRTRVRNYIERIELVPGELSFLNLDKGELTGLEVDGAYRVDADWSLTFGGHLIEGRSAADDPLADVPADRVFVGSSWRGGRWSVRDRLEHRFAKNDPGSGEQAIGSASLLSGAVALALENGLELALVARNLLDEEYFNSADDKGEVARGRSLGVTLTWRN